MLKKFLENIKNIVDNHNQDKAKKEKNKGTTMPISLEKRIEKIKATFKDASDMVFRNVEIKVGNNPVSLFLIHVDGLVDKKSINDDILKPIMLESRMAKLELKTNAPDELYKMIKNNILTSVQVTDASTYEEMYLDILSGDTALLIDGYPIALIISNRGWQSRSVAEPETEALVQGPKDCFVETLRFNTAMLRRRLRTSDLKLLSNKIGTRSQTDVVIAYIDGIANPDLVAEVKARISKINIDAILGSTYIEEQIEDNPYSPFPQIEHTERPDKVCASLLEGRVAIIVDGSPFILIVPVVFWQFIASSEDYYESDHFAAFSRLLRMGSAVISLLAPSVYIAVTTFHQEMLPTGLLLSIAAQREGVPFPAVVEAFMLEVAFEILREGGIRLPKPVGQSVSIVGALIIGQAAVQAGLVSPAMVIVVSLTGIASMTIPAFNMSIALRLLRFPIMIMASIFGFYGIMLSLLFILTHMCALRSFGVPYLSPVAPAHYSSWKDIFVRVPWWKMTERSRIFQPQDLKRQETTRGGEHE